MQQQLVLAAIFIVHSMVQHVRRTENGKHEKQQQEQSSFTLMPLHFLLRAFDHAHQLSLGGCKSSPQDEANAAVIRRIGDIGVGDIFILLLCRYFGDTLALQHLRSGVGNAHLVTRFHLKILILIQLYKSLLHLRHGFTGQAGLVHDQGALQEEQIGRNDVTAFVFHDLLLADLFAGSTIIAILGKVRLDTCQTHDITGQQIWRFALNPLVQPVHKDGTRLVPHPTQRAQTLDSGKDDGGFER
mmetsp:Transcript_7385/g.21629  ORF Transcript_7385/g.21629 Transcript_7385/m.21629 type:complete len:243 (-) Transcript_7385:1199-1927(-)